MKTDALNDDVLIDAARTGSAVAFNQLVDRYRAPVVRLAYRLTHDPDEAKDIAQDAFLRAYRRLDTFRPDRPFARWLYVIARNASLDSIRRRKRAQAHEQNFTVLPDLGPEDVVIQNAETDRIRAALATLPGHYRTVLELYYLEGLLYREIADRLTIPIGTVKTYIMRAKRRLREVLGESEAPLAA